MRFVHSVFRLREQTRLQLLQAKHELRELVVPPTTLRPVLAEHGFRAGAVSGCEWEFELSEDRGDSPVPSGFTVQSLADTSAPDYPGIADCIRSAFGSEFDSEPGLRSLEANPLFRPDLSVVARSLDGRVAAYCRGTVDPDSGVAGIDPVCCRPEFQRRGLSRAIVQACFRAQRLNGGRFCYIGSAPEPAPGTYLYRALSPSRRITLTSWTR